MLVIDGMKVDKEILKCWIEDGLSFINEKYQLEFIIMDLVKYGNSLEGLAKVYNKVKGYIEDNTQ